MQRLAKDARQGARRPLDERRWQPAVGDRGHPRDPPGAGRAARHRSIADLPCGDFISCRASSTATPSAASTSPTRRHCRAARRGAAAHLRPRRRRRRAWQRALAFDLAAETLWPVDLVIVRDVSSTSTRREACRCCATSTARARATCCRRASRRQHARSSTRVPPSPRFGRQPPGRALPPAAAAARRWQDGAGNARDGQRVLGLWPLPLWAPASPAAAAAVQSTAASMAAPPPTRTYLALGGGGDGGAVFEAARSILVVPSSAKGVGAARHEYGGFGRRGTASWLCARAARLGDHAARRAVLPRSALPILRTFTAIRAGPAATRSSCRPTGCRRRSSGRC